MNKNRIEGVAKQGEQAPICKALVTKAKRRRCGDCGLRGQASEVYQILKNQKNA
jgi:hypothetical protein